MAKLEITSAEHSAAKKYQKELKAMGISMTLKECYVELNSRKRAMKTLGMGRIF